MNIQITEGALPEISPVARSHEIERAASDVWITGCQANIRMRTIITKLNGSLHSAGVEDATTLLDEMMAKLSELTDRIEAQKDIQIEYIRGER
jgi:hypothetical protein